MSTDVVNLCNVMDDQVMVAILIHVVSIFITYKDFSNSFSKLLCSVRCELDDLLIARVLRKIQFVLLFQGSMKIVNPLQTRDQRSVERTTTRTSERISRPGNAFPYSPSRQTSAQSSSPGPQAPTLQKPSLPLSHHPLLQFS